jgi:hypothetical protein
MREVMPRCGARSLMKIVVQESMCQGVMGVRVRTSSRRQVHESLLCPSACLCDGVLQLKRGRLRVSTRGSSSSLKRVVNQCIALGWTVCSTVASVAG